MVPCCHSSGGRNRLCSVAVEASHASFGVCVGEWGVRVASGVLLASDNNHDFHYYRRWNLRRSLLKGPLSSSPPPVTCSSVEASPQSRADFERSLS
jgi:hypothetical protein